MPRNKIREYIRRFIEDALVHSQRNKSPDDGIDLDQEPTNAGSTDTIAGDFGMGGRFGSMNNIWEWWTSPDTMETKENEPTWMQPEWMHDDTHNPGDIWKTASGMYGAVNQAEELDYFDNSRAAQDYVDGPQGSTNIFPNVQPGSIPLQRNAGVTKSPTGVPLTSPDLRDFPTFKDIEHDQEELDKISGADGPMNQTNQSNTSPYFGMPDFNGMDPRFYDFEDPINLDKEQVEKPEYLPMSDIPREPGDEDPHLQTGTGHEFPDEKYWIYPKDYPKEQRDPNEEEGDFSPPSSEEMDVMYRTWLKHHPEDAVDEAGTRLNPNLARTQSGMWVARNPATGNVQYFDDKTQADEYVSGRGEETDRPVRLAVSHESLSYQLSDYLDEMLSERNYRQEYDRYQGSPEQKKRRAMRNKVRREALRKGEVKKGDGVDIHHKDHNTFNDSDKNLKKMTQGANRSDNLHHPGEKMEASEVGTEESKEKKITKILLLALLKTIIAERQRAQGLGYEDKQPNGPADKGPEYTDDKGVHWRYDDGTDSYVTDAAEPEPKKPAGGFKPPGGTDEEEAEYQRQRHEEDKARIRQLMYKISGDPTWKHN